MIIFYNKKTGEIVGTVDGRVHGKEHLKMWIGDKEKVDRLVIQWKPTGKETKQVIEEKKFVPIPNLIDKHGHQLYRIAVRKRVISSQELEPDYLQKELIAEIEKNSSKLYNYKVNTKTKKLIKK